MARVLARYLSKEMAVLGLFEAVLSFLFIAAFQEAFDGVTPLRNAAADPAWNAVDLAAVAALSMGATAATIGLYRPEVCRDPRRMLIIAAAACAVASPVILLVSSSLHLGMQFSPVSWLAKVVGGWLAAVLATRLAFHLVRRHERFVRRVLVIGEGPRAIRFCDSLRHFRGRSFEPVLAATLDPAALAAVTVRPRRFWAVVTTGDAGDAPRMPAHQAGLGRAITPITDSEFQEYYFGRVDLDGAGRAWLPIAGHRPRRTGSDAMKRGFDIVISAVLLVLCLPLMLVVAVLIKLDSPGPVLYRQQRTGLHGVPFTLLKFRSMAVNAEAGGKPCWAQKRDPRATRIGRLMRQTRIDELPQLINVLRGDMAMIGPRPERPHFVAELARAIPLYQQRSLVKPGITGWAQINYPYGASVEDAREKLAFDLYYVKYRGVMLDLFILWSTFRVILLREGAR